MIQLVLKKTQSFFSKNYAICNIFFFKCVYIQGCTKSPGPLKHIFEK